MKNYRLILCLTLLAFLSFSAAAIADVCNVNCRSNPTMQKKVSYKDWGDVSKWETWDGGDLPYTNFAILNGFNRCRNVDGDKTTYHLEVDYDEMDNETDTGWETLDPKYEWYERYDDPYTMHNTFYCNSLTSKSGTAQECITNADCDTGSCWNEDRLVGMSDYWHGSWMGSFYSIDNYFQNSWDSRFTSTEPHCVAGNFKMTMYDKSSGVETVVKTTEWRQLPNLDLSGNEENHKRGQNSMDSTTDKKGSYVNTTGPDGHPRGYADQCILDGDAAIPCDQITPQEKADGRSRPATIQEAGCSFIALVQSIENHVGHSVNWKTLYKYLYKKNDQGINGFNGNGPEVDFGQGSNGQGTAMPRIRQFLENYNMCWEPCDRELIDCYALQDGLPIVATPGHITNPGGTRQDGKWVEYSTTYGRLLDIATEEEGWNDMTGFRLTKEWGCYVLKEGDDCPDIPNDDVEITTTCGG